MDEQSEISISPQAHTLYQEGATKIFSDSWRKTKRTLYFGFLPALMLAAGVTLYGGVSTYNEFHKSNGVVAKYHALKKEKNHLDECVNNPVLLELNQEESTPQSLEKTLKSYRERSTVLESDITKLSETKAVQAYHENVGVGILGGIATLLVLGSGIGYIAHKNTRSHEKAYDLWNAILADEEHKSKVEPATQVSENSSKEYEDASIE